MKDWDDLVLFDTSEIDCHSNIIFLCPECNNNIWFKHIGYVDDPATDERVFLNSCVKCSTRWKICINLDDKEEMTKYITERNWKNKK